MESFPGILGILIIRQVRPIDSATLAFFLMNCVELEDGSTENKLSS